jgi:hypothetical protein
MPVLFGLAWLLLVYLLLGSFPIRFLHRIGPPCT